MPKNLGHFESLARSYTDTAIKTLAGIMMEQTSPPMARIVAAKVLLDRGRGKPKEMHHSEVDDNKTLLKVVNEIVQMRPASRSNSPTGRRCSSAPHSAATATAMAMAQVLTSGVLKVRTAPVFAPLLAPARYKGAWAAAESGKSHSLPA